MSWIDDLSAFASGVQIPDVSQYYGPIVENAPLPVEGPSPEDIAAYRPFSPLRQSARVIPPGSEFVTGGAYPQSPVPTVPVQEAMRMVGADSSGMGPYVASGTPNERAWRGMPGDSRYAALYHDVRGPNAPVPSADPSAYPDVNAPQTGPWFQRVNSLMSDLYNFNRQNMPGVYGRNPLR